MYYKSLSKILLGCIVTSGISINGYSQQKSDTEKFFEISKGMEIYTNVLKSLNMEYVDPINPSELNKTAIDAMLEDLDPYTNLITEAETNDFESQSTGKYGGIGASIGDNRDSQLVVFYVQENGPAFQAGLKMGDFVTAIDGKPTKNKKQLDDLNIFLKGTPGTIVTLTTKNPKSGAIKEIKITRGEITIPSVPYAGFLDKDKKIAYVILTQFTKNCAYEVRTSLQKLKEEAGGELKGIVLDLRSNPGGIVDEAIAICNLFVKRNTLIVSTKSKNKDLDKQYKTQNEGWDIETPLAVLINGRSASASEIVSGTIQDLDRGVVIGAKSFGKGLVQTVRPVGYNNYLKLTISKYYTPSGRCIQALDYSHRNLDGSVSTVPDSLKHQFKTSKGRVVKDGGGIDPDVQIKTEYYSRISAELSRNNYIFDYATDYYYAHPTIAPAATFKITEEDFTKFSGWLKTKKFNYTSNTEEIITALKKESAEEKYNENLKTEIANLEAKLKATKDGELMKNKKEIMELLTKEIVGRYYYQQGETINSLNKEDQTIIKTLEILNNKEQYDKILK